MTPASRRRRVVVAIDDTIGPKMAGPGIRAWHIADVLAAEHEVELVTTGAADATSPRFGVRSVDDQALRELEAWCDVLVFQGWLLEGRSFLESSTKVLVADVYDPMHLEQLEQARDVGDDVRRARLRATAAALCRQLLRADFALCASERQRAFWLGHLAVLGRINDRSYDADPTLRSLIDVVPFGVPDRPPERTAPAIKGVVPGIGPDDLVILWGGGVYNWFDPVTLIEAVGRVGARHPTVRLYFMGMAHPNREMPEMAMAATARAAADRLGLTGTSVFFNEGWVAYDRRQDYLLDADVGVTTHRQHVEATMSSRTRVLDHLWAGVPTVATEGDDLSELVASRGLGLTVPPGDVAALAGALDRILGDDELRRACGRRARAVAAERTWGQTLEPLVRFCRSPRRAADLVDPDVVAHLPLALRRPVSTRRLPDELRAAVRTLRTSGPGAVARQGLARARRVLE